MDFELAITNADTMTMRIFIFFMILTVNLFLISCNNQDQGQKRIVEHISKIEKRILHDKYGGEDFNSFFKHFKQDTLFQFERTSVPFGTRIEFVTINAAGDMFDTLIKSFDKAEWRFIQWDSLNLQKIEIKDDSAIMTFRDSVLVREYLDKQIFIRSNGQWYLKDEDIIILNPTLDK